MSDTIKASIIGCGTVSPSHVESYLAADGVELVCLCDLNKERARELADKYSIPNITTDYKELYNNPDIDCVSICTDHASHAQLSIEAFRAGKHVLCEKPIAHSISAMDEVFAVLEGCPGIVFAGVFQHRFDAAIRYLKKLVGDGMFGQLLTSGVHVRCTRGPHYYEERDWRGTWEYEGGSVTINQALHSIDSLIWIMGGVSAVCGAYTNHALGDVIETEDTAVAAVKFKCGALGTIETTSSSNLVWENTLFIHGTEGSIEVREGKGIKVKFTEPGLTEKVQSEIDNCYDPQIIAAGKRYYGKTHPAQIADFIDAIRNKRDPFVCPHSARHTAEVVLGLYKSQRDGRWVDIES
ncbi:MAG: Gfo/Idh/MocA family protein [Planctomycetota bacterium]|jgi:predicted dehydrogenase